MFPSGLWAAGAVRLACSLSRPNFSSPSHLTPYGAHEPHDPEGHRGLSWAHCGHPRIPWKRPKRTSRNANFTTATRAAAAPLPGLQAGGFWTLLLQYVHGWWRRESRPTAKIKLTRRKRWLHTGGGFSKASHAPLKRRFLSFLFLYICMYIYKLVGGWWLLPRHCDHHAFLSAKGKG